MAQHAPAAQRVVDRARAASGGAAWTTVRGLHEVGSENGVPYERWLDALRYGDRTDVGAGPRKAARGYNGFGAWGFAAPARRDPNVERLALINARTDAFFAAYGYYFPGRFELRSGHVGTREAGGRQHTVIWVQPMGGEVRELWFDAKTGLLARIVERDGAKPVITELSDYRKVGRMQFPFRQTVYGGDLAKPIERVLERVELATPDRALFSLPRPR